MTAVHDIDAVRRRNRWMLVALFVLFFGGMLVAGLLRFSGWRPEASKNKGELLQPYGDLRDYAPTLADGGAYRWKDSPRTWRIVAMPRDCDGARAADCARLLADLDKVWRLMNKDADRVHVLMGGRIVASGGPELARKLEETGYEGLAAELGVETLAVEGPEPAPDPFADPGF